MRYSYYAECLEIQYCYIAILLLICCGNDDEGGEAIKKRSLCGCSIRFDI